MSFFGLIIKNPFRNRTRTALAVVGIAIGIATIVALGLITEGLKSSTEETLKAGGSDFMVVESNVSDMILSSIDENNINEIKKMNGVQEAVGVLIGVYSVKNNPYFAVMGIPPEKLSFSEVSIIKGRNFTEGKNEIILGRVASEKMDKSVGDILELSGKKFKIVGIYETGDLQQDAGAFMSLKMLQDLQNKEDKVSMIFVKITKDANLETVSDNVDQTYSKELTTIKSLEDFGKVDQGLKTIDTASWAISLLAIVIGGIGVINTMIMSVFERTREIGVLKAVGWKNKRILSMILGESVVITLVAGVVGVLMGILAIQVLMNLGMESFIEPVYSAMIFFKALLIALVVGLVGGFYPAYRASRLPPTEALRYE